MERHETATFWDDKDDFKLLGCGYRYRNRCSQWGWEALTQPDSAGTENESLRLEERQPCTEQSHLQILPLPPHLCFSRWPNDYSIRQILHQLWVLIFVTRLFGVYCSFVILMVVVCVTRFYHTAQAAHLSPRILLLLFIWKFDIVGQKTTLSRKCSTWIVKWKLRS